MSESIPTLDHLVRRHPAGTVLFREGDRGEKMYVIRSGKVQIWKRISESEITLAMLGAGEFFGEMALLEGLPRSASATVAEDSLLIEVEQPAFETLVRSRGEIAVRLMRRLSARLREADRQIQALMSRSGAARAVSLVKTLAEPADQGGRRCLPRDMTPQSLWARIGLNADETRQIARMFERAGILFKNRQGRLELGAESMFNDFLLYVELQEQYDPMNVRELADMAGVPEAEAHQIVRRLIAAKLKEANRGSTQLVDTYSTYLALKQRFEYAD
jgi:CRP/FNR family transcriptional regulator, cyclic AMP receptor protein